MKEKRIRMNDFEIKTLIKFLTFDRIHSATDLLTEEQDVLHSYAGRLKHGTRRMAGERSGRFKYHQQSDH